MSDKSTLEDSLHRKLGKEYLEAVQSFKGQNGHGLIEALDHVTSQPSMRSIADARREGRFDEQDLRQLLGYHKFALHHALIKPTEIMPVEVRREEWMTYGLISPKQTFLGDISRNPLAWSHNVEWATQRFTEKDHTTAGFHGNPGKYLCGQRMGKSKFVTVAEIPTGISSDELRKMFALEGDPTFAGQLFIVRAQIPEALSVEVAAKVPVCYKVKDNDMWATYPQFLRPPHAVPGYTSGGKGEVVINTFEIPANNLDELAAKGVTIEKCN